MFAELTHCDARFVEFQKAEEMAPARRTRSQDLASMCKRAALGRREDQWEPKQAQVASLAKVLALLGPVSTPLVIDQRQQVALSVSRLAHLLRSILKRQRELDLVLTT